MKTMVLLIFAIGLSMPLHARLGDSPFWCYNKYGTKNSRRPSDNAKSASFSKDGLFILCIFENGKCIEINYQRTQGGLSDSEIDQFLYENREGSTWTETKGIGAKYWKRSDGGTAMLSGVTLFIKAPKA